MQWSLDNLKDTKLWLRVGYTFAVLVVMSIFWNYLLYAMILLWLVQTVFLLFTGQVMDSIATYARLGLMSFYQYTEYLTYTNAEKPFPLDRLP